MTLLRALLFRNRTTAALVLAMALLMRMAVPQGMMPSAERGIWISVCSGQETSPVWLVLDDKAHKQDPGEKQHGDLPCAFAGLGMALDMPVTGQPVVAPAVANSDAHRFYNVVSIGRGLAAPPPPSTGPPILS